MTFDLKYLLPFVLPIVLLGFLRLMWWLAGAVWYDPTYAALSSCLIGFAAGGATVFSLISEGIKWNVKIGGKP